MLKRPVLCTKADPWYVKSRRKERAAVGGRNKAFPVTARSGFITTWLYLSESEEEQSQVVALTAVE